MTDVFYDQKRPLVCMAAFGVGSVLGCDMQSDPDLQAVLLYDKHRASRSLWVSDKNGVIISPIDVKKAQRKALGKFSFIPKREEGSVKKPDFICKAMAMPIRVF